MVAKLHIHFKGNNNKDIVRNGKLIRLVNYNENTFAVNIFGDNDSLETIILPLKDVDFITIKGRAVKEKTPKPEGERA